MLELIDANGYKRKAEGEDLQTLLTIAGLSENQLTYALNYFASPNVRLLERLPNGFYRLPHETIIPALRRLTGLVLAEVEQASLSLKTAYDAWQKSSKKNSAFLLKGKALREILKHLPQINWQAQDKQTFLKQCLAKRTRKRLLSGAFVVLLSLFSFYGWQVYHAYASKETLINWGLPADLYDYQTQLEKLDIRDDDIRHLRWLKELPNLKELNLTSTKIRNLNEITEKLTSLTSLVLSSNYKLSSLQGLEKLTALTSLILDDNPLSSLQGLEKLTALTSLDLSRNELNSLQGLEKLTALTSLDLSHNELNSLQGLEKLTALTSLSLAGTPVSSLQGLEMLTALTKLTALTSLDLSHNELNSLQGLEKLTALTSLDLRRNNLSSLQGLEKLTALTSLGLSPTNLSSLQGLEKLTALTSLDLTDSNLRSLQGLEKLTALTSLGLTDSNLSSLQGLPSSVTVLKLKDYSYPFAVSRWADNP